jgi:inositol oxygenase
MSEIILEEEKSKECYRKYQEDTEVAEFYKQNHINQTYEHVRKMQGEIFPLGRWKLNILEVISLLDDIVDKSDPDLSKKQIVHAIQAGEACRNACPDDDWFHLTGFIHDLGKILTHPKMQNVSQWSVVGDTFPVGCAFSEKCVYPEYFKNNPDYENKNFQSNIGIYKEKIGFDNVLMSFGHDEYLYQVLKNSSCLLPEEALYLIRFHSFYPWHQTQAYSYLANEKDWKLLPLLREFQKCDLYSKVDVELNVDTHLPYYQGLIKKYFPQSILEW